MLELLREREDLWSRLRDIHRTGRPIYLYGMGDGADKILTVLERLGVAPSGVFASDEFVRGQNFRGFPVRRFSEVKAEHGSAFVALLAFAVDYEPMLSRLYAMENECGFYAPDVPVVAEGDIRPFDLACLKESERELDLAYSLLADEQSRRVFRGTLDFRLSGKVDYLREITTDRAETWTLIRPTGEEDYVDLGAYNGDTVAEFLACAGNRYRSITALEPDAKNYEKLCRFFRERGLEHAAALRMGAWDRAETFAIKKGRRGRGSGLLNTVSGASASTETVPADTLDHILNGGPASIIKFDVEGAESRALSGASETIRRCHPRMILSAYHRNEDLFALPLQVRELWPEAKLYLRHHPYIPAWETNYYIL